MHLCQVCQNPIQAEFNLILSLLVNCTFSIPTAILGVNAALEHLLSTNVMMAKRESVTVYLSPCQSFPISVMRATGTLRLLLNSKIFSEMVLERLDEKRIKLSAVDFETFKVVPFLITVRDLSYFFKVLRGQSPVVQRCGVC